MKTNYRHTVLYYLLSLICLASQYACTDIDALLDMSGAEQTNAVILLHQAEMPQIVSRSAEEVTLENVVLYIFDASGNRLSFTSQNLDGKNYVNCYLSEQSSSVYAICNVQSPEEFATITTLEELKNKQQTITATDEIFQDGCYVMSGCILSGLQATEIGNPRTYYLDLYRLAAEFDVTIEFDPINADEGFELASVEVVNLPRKSNYLSTECPTDITVSCPTDAVYEAKQTGSSELFFNERMDVEWTDHQTNFQFRMFENRRGGESATSTYWDFLSAEEVNAGYRQLFKRELALYRKWHSATHLKITGVYSHASGAVYEAVYYVYLGADNYKDFNVRRNHRYIYHITIRSCNEIDTRIDSKNIADMTIYPSLAEGDVLDAHCNATSVLMYSPREWEIEVVNTDENPWLELSEYAVYHPGRASFRLEGSAGLRYFYLHTDEYVPGMDSDEQEAGNDYLLDGTKGIRKAKIRYRCKDEEEWKEFEVSQLPALLLILETYDARLMKRVKCEYYVERKLERKNIQWGFLQYWSLTMDDLISAGQWDGLTNTRKLYQMALYGDHSGSIPTTGGWPEDLPGVEAPAYPLYTAEGILPNDIAVGYAVNKNRDRDGNGRIDYDEVVWYMPAIKEMKELYETMHGNVALWGATDWIVDGTSDEKFHSSTPSYTAFTAENPGRNYYIKMKDGDTSIGMRNRKYNVICCRRKNAWLGDEGAHGGGNITIPDGGWTEEDDVLPK